MEATSNKNVLHDHMMTFAISFCIAFMFQSCFGMCWLCFTRCFPGPSRFSMSIFAVIWDFGTHQTVQKTQFDAIFTSCQCQSVCVCVLIGGWQRHVTKQQQQQQQQQQQHGNTSGTQGLEIKRNPNGWTLDQKMA